MNGNGDTDTKVIENLNALVQKEAVELREMLADKTLSPVKRTWILKRIDSMEEKDKKIVEECTKQLSE